MHELVHYRFKANDLDVSPGELGKYAHIPDNMPSYNLFLKEELAKLNRVATIEGGYLITAADAKEEHLKIGDKLFCVGKQVIQFYKEVTNAALFLCSAGKEVTERAMELTRKGDLVEGYLLDVLGSVLVEKAMDKVHDYLRNEMKLKELGVSNRYSPGYCEWDVREQKQLFDFFPKDFCNVTLSDSCLIFPPKAVSGIIGIGKHVKYRKHVCHLCNSANCIYRNTKNMI